MALSGVSLEERSQFEQIILASQTDKLLSAQLLSALSDAQKTKFIRYLAQKVDRQSHKLEKLKSLEAELDAQMHLLEHRVALCFTKSSFNKNVSVDPSQGSAEEIRPVKKKRSGSCTLF